VNRQPIESRMLHSFAYDAEREIHGDCNSARDGTPGLSIDIQNCGRRSRQRLCRGDIKGKTFPEFY
jgi:hypothetical protein